MSRQKRKLRIGAGAGYSGDRIDPAEDLARRGNLDYLVFECLAERTIALAQLRRLKNPEEGFDPLLEARMQACLKACAAQGTRIITNMGAANPIGGMVQILKTAKAIGLKKLKVAAVHGDEVLESLREGDFECLPDEPEFTIDRNAISANAYLGVAPIVEALKNGADIVITGRVADPSLFLAPLVYEFGWKLDDWDLLGQGTAFGHLLECAGQVTGGYFADPGFKEVPELDRLGFPIGEIEENGMFSITKLPDTGGRVCLATCKEQLLYEIQDPQKYFTPDVVADFSQITMKQAETDRVEISGGQGKAKTAKLKVSVGFREGFLAEGQISYGGAGALDRGRQALEILKKRIKRFYPEVAEIRSDLIGYNALYGHLEKPGEPSEVRLRFAAKVGDQGMAQSIVNEVEALYTNGPAGGGGATKSVTEIIGIRSALIDENKVQPQITYRSLV